MPMRSPCFPFITLLGIILTRPLLCVCVRVCACGCVSPHSATGPAVDFYVFGFGKAPVPQHATKPLEQAGSKLQRTPFQAFPTGLPPPVYVPQLVADAHAIFLPYFFVSSSRWQRYFRPHGCGTPMHAVQSGVESVGTVSLHQYAPCTQPLYAIDCWLDSIL